MRKFIVILMIIAFLFGLVMLVIGVKDAVISEYSKVTNPELWIVEEFETIIAETVKETVKEDGEVIEVYITPSSESLSSNISEIIKTIESKGLMFDSIEIDCRKDYEGNPDLSMVLYVYHDDIKLNFRVDPDENTTKEFFDDVDNVEHKLDIMVGE